MNEKVKNPKLLRRQYNRSQQKRAFNHFLCCGKEIKITVKLVVCAKISEVIYINCIMKSM